MSIPKLIVVLLVMSLTACTTMQNAARPGVPAQSFADHFDAVAAARNTDLLRQILVGFPKGADLHTHLSGAVHVGDLLDIAEAHGYHALFTRHPRSFEGFVLRSRPGTIQGKCSDALARKDLTLDCVSVASLGPADRERIFHSLVLDTEDPERSEQAQFREFTRIFGRLDELTDNTDVMPDLVRAVITDASAQNISYLELKVSPMGRTDSNGNPVAIDALAHSLERAAKTVNGSLRANGKNTVTVRFIGSTTRWSTTREGGPSSYAPIACNPGCPTRVEQLYFLATGRGHPWFVAMDLVGLPESPIAVRPGFADVAADFADLRKRFGEARLTLHAGESLNSQFDANIEQAIGIGATRLGHAYKLDTVPSAKNSVCGRPIAIEISLTSNLRLGLPPTSDLRDHPVRNFMSGATCGGTPLVVTLNTDDAGVFATTLSGEFLRATLAFDLRWKDIVKLAENSIKFSFADPATKAALLSDWQSRLARFERTFPRSAP